MSLTENNDIAARMYEREGLYTFLSRVFCRELDKEYVTTLLQDGTFTNSGDIDSGEEFGKGLIMLHEALNAWKLKSVDETVGKLRRDFAHLFLVKNEGAVHPYESVYLGPEKLLMQEPYDKVRECYHEAGIVRNEYTYEIEDHVGVECEFMAMLCKLSGDACKENNGEEFKRWLLLQKSFLGNHLVRWTPFLCEDVLERTGSPFYRGVAHLMKGFIQMEMSDGQGTAD